MAQQSLLVSAVAERYQAQAVAFITDQFANPDDTTFDITNMSLDDLVARVEQATKDGTLPQLNAQLAQQILPMLMQQEQANAGTT